MHTQSIRTVTVIKLDFWDSVKVLFGKRIKVTVRMDIPQENEIRAFNASEIVEIESATKHLFSKDKPDFGLISPH